MNKKLLIAAVGAALAAGSVAANAAATVYGKLNLGIAQVSNSEDGVMGITDDASRIGIKGDEDLGGGLKAIYMWEMTLDADNGAFGGSSAAGGSSSNGSRDVYAGLTGGWGTVRVGSFNSAYKNVSVPLEIFGDTIGDFTHTTFQGESRTANTISYTSPNFNGFSLNVERSHSETKNSVPATDVDERNPTVVTLSYSMGPLYIAVGSNSFDDEPYEMKSLVDTGGTAITDTFTLAMKSAQKIAAKYSIGPFGIWLVQETAKGETTALSGVMPAGTELELKTQHLGVSFALGANTTLAATQTNYKVEGEDLAKQTALGLVHNLSKSTAVKVVTTSLKNEDGVGSAGRILGSGGIGLKQPGADTSSPGTGETVSGTQVQLSVSF